MTGLTVEMQSFCRSFAVDWKSKGSPFVVPPLYSKEDSDCKRGPPGGVWNSDFPWKNRSYPEIPWIIFDFPDSEFPFSLSRQVFCSLLGDLWKRLKIKQFYRKFVPGYNLGLSGEFWTPNSREKMVFVFIRSRQNYLSRYHAIISYLTRLPNRKIKKYSVP